MAEPKGLDVYSKEYADFASTIITKLFNDGFIVNKITFEDFEIRNSKKYGKKVVAQVTTTLTIEA
jgi:hypothetical protein